MALLVHLVRSTLNFLVCQPTWATPGCFLDACRTRGSAREEIGGPLVLEPLCPDTGQGLHRHGRDGWQSPPREELLRADSLKCACECDPIALIIAHPRRFPGLFSQCRGTRKRGLGAKLRSSSAQETSRPKTRFLFLWAVLRSKANNMVWSVRASPIVGVIESGVHKAKDHQCRDRRCHVRRSFWGRQVPNPLGNICRMAALKIDAVDIPFLQLLSTKLNCE